MDVLLIVQNDRKVRDAVPRIREQGLSRVTIQNTQITFTLGVMHTPPDDPTGQAEGGVLAGSPNRIVSAIVGFAEHLAANKPDDLIEFSVVFIFHQTSRRVVERITRAMGLLNRDRRWRRMAYRHTKHIRVPRVWLLSCESATESVTTDGNLIRFIAQSHLMRTDAEKAFRTEASPPPNTPPSFYEPVIMTFSTGDALTGGITLDPEQVGFRRLPIRSYHWRTGFVWEPTPAGQDEATFHNGTPTSGQIHQHQGGQSLGAIDVPNGTNVNIFSYPPP